jgi:hypothetical protein
VDNPKESFMTRQQQALYDAYRNKHPEISEDEARRWALENAAWINANVAEVTVEEVPFSELPQ